MKTTSELSMELDAAYTDLQTLVRELGETEARLYQAQVELADARSRVILHHDPKDLGANEAQREAKVQETTYIERHALRAVEGGRAVLRYRVEVARLRVDHARQDVRLLEVEARNYELPTLEHAGF